MKKLALSPLTIAKRRFGSERGVILILACFSMPVIIGMLGLGIDLSVMYSIKAKLQMACDGAAVSALRSLSLAQDTASQTAIANSIAQQWFRSNFTGSYLGASANVVPTVTVVDQASFRTVTVTANTSAPTYFMKYWGRAATPIGAVSQTSRRDVAIIMVLDRSGSMASGNYNGLTACDVMKQSAKLFTGMFQQGRDTIGLVTFAETVQVAQPPTTSFQSALGYTNSSGSSAGVLDTISCNGGTNTSSAVSIGWNELYKLQLPGALNIMVLFTDGLPTAGTFNFQQAMAAGSGCKDGTGLAIVSGGNMNTNPANWIGPEANLGSTVSLGANSFFPPIQGPIAALYGDGTGMNGVSPFFSPTLGTYLEVQVKNPAGCSFSGWDPTNDIAFVPDQDYWNNPTTGYRTGMSTTSGGHIQLNVGNVGNVNVNLADNAANFARLPHVFSNGVAMPGTIVNAIGLGGTGGVDYTLLQRMANDQHGDPSVPYLDYPGYNPNQPKGQFIYVPDADQLRTAFVKLASQILRISR